MFDTRVSGLHGRFVKWLMPRFSSERRKHLRVSYLDVPASSYSDGVTLEQKVAAALHVVAHGADGTGIATMAALMHPVKRFSQEAAEREACRLLSKVHLALLSTLPQQDKLQIVQDQALRLRVR